MFENLENEIKFHHIGIAVKEFKGSVNFYKTLGYYPSLPIIDENQKVEIIILSSDFLPTVELIKPLAETSPVNKYLERDNVAIYHLSFVVDNLPRTLDTLKRKHRIICVSKPKPAVALGGNRVSFYYIKDVGLVEFIEK